MKNNRQRGWRFLGLILIIAHAPWIVIVFDGAWLMIAYTCYSIFIMIAGYKLLIKKNNE